MRKRNHWLAILLVIFILIANPTSVFAATSSSTTPPPAPTIGATPTTPTNGNVTITVYYPNTAAVKQYKLGTNGTWTKYSNSFAVTANTYVYARYQTKTGYWSTLGGLPITNIDKTPPTSPTFTASQTAPTNQSVTVAINFSSDSTSKQYKLGSSTTWISYTAPVVLSSNNTISARASDNVGNWSSITSYTVANIDKTAPSVPVLTADTTTPTNGLVNVAIGYPSDASMKQYRVGTSGTWTNYSVPVVISSNTTVYAKAQDSAGNWSAEGSLIVSNIDKDPPADPTFSASSTTPTNQSVSVAINFSSDSYVKQYKLGSDGTWTDYSAPVTVSSNDILYAKSSDQVGNWTSEVSYEITNIDKVAPMSPVFTVSTAELTNQEISVIISFSADSVVKQYKIGSSGSWIDYSSSISIDSNDTVYARALDNAGNWSPEASYAIGNIDRTPPDNPVIAASETSPTNQSVTVSIQFSVDSNMRQYKLGSSGTWTDYSEALIISENTSIYARASDFAGNWSAESSYTIDNIDRVPPAEPVLTASTTELTNQDVALRIEFSSDSSIRQFKLGSSGNWTDYSGPVAVGSNDTVFAKACDNAGNWSSEASYVVGNIDKTAPDAPTFSASAIQPTNQSVTVTINFSSDSVIKQYRLGSIGNWVDYSSPITLEANDMIFSKASDAVGNWTQETSYEITNIQKAPPADPIFTASSTELTNQDVVINITYSTSSSIKLYKLGDAGLWTDYSGPVLISANTIIYAKASDSAGNWSQEVSCSVSNIDKTAPANPVISASTTAPTNQAVIITISYSDDSSLKQYKIGTTGTWSDYTVPVVLSSNNTVYAKASDSTGNWTPEASYTVSNIDATAPEKPSFSASTTTWTSRPVTLTILYSGDSTVKQYKVGAAGTWTNYTAPIKVSSNGIIYAKSSDSVGNWSIEGSYAVTNITKIVLGYTVKNSSTDMSSYNSMVANVNALNEIATATYGIDGLGNLSGMAPADQISYANNNGIITKLMVSNNFDPNIAKQMLESPTNRQNLKNNILNQLKANNYKGVDIDIENIPAANRTHFTTFMSEIYSALKPLGYEVSVAVPAKTYDSSTATWNYAFDYKSLALYSDYLMLMAYDEHYPGGKAGSIASIGWVTSVVDYALTVVPKEKIVLGMAAYGYDWVGTTTKAYSINGCLNLANQYGATINFDSATKSKYFTYTVNGVAHTVWFEDGETIAYKLDLANARDLKGVGIWRLGLENTNYWNTIKSKLNK
ncbi:MAG: glycosyl hydrolase family 18 protein [Clostridia bacterium]|nr:glycosyl hydrolase family 18 protein [Clostridia bacterium]